MAFIEMDFASGGGSAECEFQIYDQQLTMPSNGQISDIGFEPTYISITSFSYNNIGIKIVYDASISTTQYKTYYNGTTTDKNIGDTSNAGFTYIGADKVIINPTYASKWGKTEVVAIRHVK